MFDRLQRPGASLAALLLAALPSAGQGASGLAQPARPVSIDPAVAFLAPYGLDQFSEHYVDALSAFLRAQERFELGQHHKARKILDELWAQYPPGTAVWTQLPTQPFGINVGSPPAYYGLRMLDDAVDWRLQEPQAPPLRTARLTVVLIGQSNGIEPQNQLQLVLGGGLPVQHELDPRLLADDSAIVHQSLGLFRDYVLAASDGALGVEVEIVHLPDADLAVQATQASNVAFAGLEDFSDVWPLLDPEVRQQTDWWWVLYPSHVPEHLPDFQNKEFVTGGMGTGPDAQSPCFLIDDRWLVRKPPHLGSGDYTDVEREAYLPQWLQHEFFHHLFRTYPEFGLEATPHQWFDLGTWPADFEGLFEPDYFHEALHKRLKDALPPLVAALRYATADFPWDTLELTELVDVYERLPIQNPWHIGSIQFGPQLEWQNQAGVDWNLTPALDAGELLTGPDCPYFGDSWSSDRFDLRPQRDELGDLTGLIEGFLFNYELYRRQGF